MNGAAHRIAAGAGIGLYLAHCEQEAGESSLWPIGGGLTASAFTCLPDILEPALHPNHRQFFHSLTFAVILGFGLRKLYLWQPDDKNDVLLRKLGLVIGSAYLFHLALDATTPKSLPLVGRL